MNKIQQATFICIIVFFIACESNTETIVTTPTEKFLFEDGFETQNNSLTELFPADNSRWTLIQQTDPSNATNEISIIDTEVSEGQNAIRFLAYESNTLLSKIDIEKGGLNIRAGDKLLISADFYINGNQSIENLLLIDLECCSCWDPTVGNNLGSENQCPGVRLMMSGGNDFLSIERGKILGTTLQQTSVPFPRNQWVSVQWEMTMSATESGVNKLFINGTEVLNEFGMNMPNASIFREIFQNQGIEFTLQEPTFYERVQIGVTANPTAETVELFVDNFSISVE
ncbi:heparin lyase I family protein [uncultured Kordia sp.]|uniref:heparin lyase I family protein n=1 Tax=uncultured Kordia sp. TaxID=507699 RepID=UPI00262BD996|nr:heparin lyase I family protein [uncultured Kordia sp.]